MKKLILKLTERQVERIQSCIARDYVDGKIDNERNGPSIELAWLRSLVTLGNSIERQTGVESEVRNEAEHYARGPRDPEKPSRKTLEKILRSLELSS
jgi:hypothetical protein